MRASPEGEPRTWLLLLEPAGRPGWRQMAVDRALLDLAAREGVFVVRFYTWDPPCLSFGAHEPAVRRYDRARIEALGLDVTRRPTGGRAVWHARELTYAVAAPAGALGSLPDAYQTLHGVLAAGVGRLALAPALAPAPARAPELASGACFAAAVGGEVTVAGRKVLGSAQVRLGGGLLQHGSLLLGNDQAMVRSVTAGAAPPAGEASLGSLRGSEVTWDEAARAMTAAFTTWAGAAPTGAPDGRALEALAAPWEEHYRDPAWIWRR